jgi:hypothetical protein
VPHFFKGFGAALLFDGDRRFLDAWSAGIDIGEDG